MTMTAPIPAPDQPVLAAPATPRCRFCGTALTHTLVDLGMSPLCESFLAADELDAMEPFYPLHVRVCPSCLLVQLPAYVAPEEIFREYAYFSSYSDSWVEHGRRYVDGHHRPPRAGPEARTSSSSPATTATCCSTSWPRGVPVLGIEPAANVAEAARARGVETLAEFFGLALARQLVADGRAADLIIGNNVLAQVPDLNDFVAGIADAPQARRGGHAGVPAPRPADRGEPVRHHLPRALLVLLAGTVAPHRRRARPARSSTSRSCRRTADRCACTWPVETAPTGRRPRRCRRCWRGRRPAATTASTATRASPPGSNGSSGICWRFLIRPREKGQRAVGYGAPGKGNTLLNYCGIRTDLLEFTVDRNPYKHGRFTPGTHIPILPPEHLAAERPDVVLILPWNLRIEISAQLADVRAGAAASSWPSPGSRSWRRDGPGMAPHEGRPVLRRPRRSACASTRNRCPSPWCPSATARSCGT